MSFLELRTSVFDRLGRRALALAVWLAIVGTVMAIAAETPRHGGVLDRYDIAEPGRLDVHTESAAAVLQATAGVFSGLLQMDPSGPSLVPGLVVGVAVWGLNLLGDGLRDLADPRRRDRLE